MCHEVNQSLRSVSRHEPITTKYATASTNHYEVCHTVTQSLITPKCVSHPITTRGTQCKNNSITVWPTAGHTFQFDSNLVVTRIKDDNSVPQTRPTKNVKHLFSRSTSTISNYVATHSIRPRPRICNTTSCITYINKTFQKPPRYYSYVCYGAYKLISSDFTTTSRESCELLRKRTE